MRNLTVSPDRIAADIEALAAITEPDRPYTRRAFTPVFLKGRDYLIQHFHDAGLTPRIDAAGNLIGHRAGRASGRGTIMLGSHSDTVPDGGRFDGVAGVVAALEVARALNEERSSSTTTSRSSTSLPKRLPFSASPVSAAAASPAFGPPSGWSGITRA